MGVTNYLIPGMILQVSKTKYINIINYRCKYHLWKLLPPAIPLCLFSTFFHLSHEKTFCFMNLLVGFWGFSCHGQFHNPHYCIYKVNPLYIHGQNNPGFFFTCSHLLHTPINPSFFSADSHSRMLLCKVQQLKNILNLRYLKSGMNLNET